MTHKDIITHQRQVEIHLSFLLHGFVYYNAKLKMEKPRMRPTPPADVPSLNTRNNRQGTDKVYNKNTGESIMVETIIVAVLSLLGTLGGSYFSNRRSAVLISYRLEQLEKKVEAHNNLVERTYCLEKRCDLADEKFKVANHRIDDLEKEG